MTVTTTGLGPATLDSCAYAWLAPNTLAAATRIAITRVMTDLLVSPPRTLQLSTSVQRIPIRQEVDRVLRRVRDAITCQTNDGDLRLLDDVGYRSICRIMTGCRKRYDEQRLRML